MDHPLQTSSNPFSSSHQRLIPTAAALFHRSPPPPPSSTALVAVSSSTAVVANPGSIAISSSSFDLHRCGLLLHRPRSFDLQRPAPPPSQKPPRVPSFEIVRVFRTIASGSIASGSRLLGFDGDSGGWWWLNGRWRGRSEGFGPPLLQKMFADVVRRPQTFYL
ncbi:hypothetical protein E3N88_42330 [Mikania micrantha]|uniref:Uncharacterized protein n=1 Tax=Mikania micrantha TaxID=192012 RepID=A0A5N6LI49_9ASTR|nr:hypothetical protein E3N88_42330 [Mikania micrantha]